MSTVILGGGIIGTSIAYYLSKSQPESEIHIIEQSPELFSSASGYAGGFLARDWFAPSLTSLGALSFDLHHQLSSENDGARKWGFMKGTAFNLDSGPNQRRGGAGGDDWIHEGTSRAETAAVVDAVSAEWPAWLTKQKGCFIEGINEGETVAQVDPLRLSQFLMNEAVLQGVKLHQPAKATQTMKYEDGIISAINILDLQSRSDFILPCTNLVLSAGAWTPQVLQELFPSNSISLDILPLAGYSLVVRSPRHTLDHERIVNAGRSHALFTEHPSSCGFSPEIFTREGGEIYIAGLNPDLELPSCAEDVRQLWDPAEMQKLKDVAICLMGQLPKDSSESSNSIINIDDLEILREGLCFRLAGSNEIPTIGRVGDSLLGNGLRTSAQGGVYIATGHGPWGISLSLGTGKVMSDLILGEPASVDVRQLAVQ